MTAADDRAAMVVLLRTGRRPWVEYAELVEEHGGARAVLEAELEAQAVPLPQQTSLFPDEQSANGPKAQPPTDELLDHARADLDRWDARGMRLVTVLDPGYPPNLRAVHDRPPMVFIAGRLTPADARGVAVVGARKATPAGVESARAMAEHLIHSGYSVISGLAAGIDTAAHTSALAHKGRTVAVIGTGLARTYPPENEPLQQRIADECAVISQFWPDSPPSRRSFPMRNAVMSGVALATVVVEASETSGARTQARLALAQGRPVFFAGSLVERQPWAREYATRPGTRVVNDPAEVTTILHALTASDPLLA
ncbi:MAG TPA: DNA-processing protein DprA [Solirubrobacteraceae bacterium]|nr:DNA-processing protein DprA [Solirubrobacteraceae bacterium]